MLRPAFSLIGLLITVACMAVLLAISMNALNTAITGQGSAMENTVRSTEDKMVLAGLYQALAVSSLDHRSDYIVPSRLTPGQDRSLDTTASLFSLLVAQKYIKPEQLVSGNEYSGYVEVDDDYDYTAYRPAEGVYWDPGFMADLKDLSNTSFAHMPLFGERFDRKWKATLDASFPLLGNRGPRDGIADPSSWTYGRNEQWGGHVVFGDGHVEFLTTFTPGHVTYSPDRGARTPDNIYAMEDGPDGVDAVLSFTKTMDPERGPELQYD